MKKRKSVYGGLVKYHILPEVVMAYCFAVSGRMGKAQQHRGSVVSEPGGRTAAKSPIRDPCTTRADHSERKEEIPYYRNPVTANRFEYLMASEVKDGR